MGVLENSTFIGVLSISLIVALVIICFLLLFLKGGKERNRKRWEEQERKWQEERQKEGDLFVRSLIEPTKKGEIEWEKGSYAFCVYYNSVWIFLFIDPYDFERKWVHTYEMDRTIQGSLVEELAELLISRYGSLPKKELPKKEIE